MVVPQQPAESLSTLNLAFAAADFVARLYVFVTEPLMMSFGVIMDKEFANSVSQRRFSEEDHSLKAFRFQGAEKSLQMSVHPRRQLHLIATMGVKLFG
jgi:hypothetical protein